MKKSTVSHNTTKDLVNELAKRLGDWHEDPEPVYDEFFANCNTMHLEMVYRNLMNVIRQYKG